MTSREEENRAMEREDEFRGDAGEPDMATGKGPISQLSNDDRLFFLT